MRGNMGNVRNRMPRKRFLGGIAAGLGAAVVGASGDAHAEGGNTVYFPGTDYTATNTLGEYTQLLDAITDAGENGTIIVEAGAWPISTNTDYIYFNLFNMNIPIGSYPLMNGQTIKGQGFDSYGNAQSRLMFKVPALWGLSFGLRCTGSNIMIEGLGLENVNVNSTAPILLGGQNNIVKDNDLRGGNHAGLFIGGRASNCLVSGNTIQAYTRGIFLWAIFFDPSSIAKNEYVTISGNTFIGTLTNSYDGHPTGIDISYGSKYITVSDNDLTKLTSMGSQIRVRTNNNILKNNDYGNLDLESGIAGAWIQGSYNTLTNENFWGVYPGKYKVDDQMYWGVPCLVFVEGSEGNKVTALKSGQALQGITKCTQILDQYYEEFGILLNDIPGLDGCERMPWSDLQEIKARIEQMKTEQEPLSL